MSLSGLRIHFVNIMQEIDGFSPLDAHFGNIPKENDILVGLGAHLVQIMQEIPGVFFLLDVHFGNLS